MTKDEHETRAMLMGRYYDERDGTYCIIDANDMIATDDMVDAMTLEPVTYEEARRRVKGGYINDGTSYY